jgi:hypothetical protein
MVMNIIHIYHWTSFMIRSNYALICGACRSLLSYGEVTNTLCFYAMYLYFRIYARGKQAV